MPFAVGCCIITLFLEEPQAWAFLKRRKRLMRGTANIYLDLEMQNSIQVPPFSQSFDKISIAFLFRVALTNLILMRRFEMLRCEVGRCILLC